MNSKYIIIRWIISAISILAATWLVPGFQIQGNGILVALVVALILGLVNAIIRPILIFLSCGCIVATLGLFLLVVNAATLWITARICEFLGLGFVIQDFTTALIGSILISIISWLLSIFLIGDNERGRK